MSPVIYFIAAVAEISGCFAQEYGRFFNPHGYIFLKSVNYSMARDSMKSWKPVFILVESLSTLIL